MESILGHWDPTPEPIAQVVFDFDNTLFNTESVKEQFYEMARIHGYSDLEVYAIYQMARAHGEKMTMSLSRYLATLKKCILQDGKTFLAEEVGNLIAQMHAQGNLVEGAEELLQFCKEQNIPRCVLSLGAPAWQEEKVIQSGITPYFDAGTIFYTEHQYGGKLDVLKSMRTMMKHPVCLVNDKPDETGMLLRELPNVVALVRIEERDHRYDHRDFRELERAFRGRVMCSSSLHELGAHLINHFSL
jgi:phosphoglycolate phosphatase-like HAD superfamily hydrolase